MLATMRMGHQEGDDNHDTQSRIVPLENAPQEDKLGGLCAWVLSSVDGS